MTRYFAFTAEFSGITDRIITKASVFNINPLNNDSSESMKVHALWDTGATQSVVDKKVVETLSLAPRGLTTMHTAGGIITSRTYKIWVELPNGIKIRDVLVSEADFEASNFELLIGMDIICCGDFAITNKTGKTKLSFSAPPLFDIDFLFELKKLEPKTRRNDPCPCGKKKSGGRAMKFKECCGK